MCIKALTLAVIGGFALISAQPATAQNVASVAPGPAQAAASNSRLLVFSASRNDSSERYAIQLAGERAMARTPRGLTAYRDIRDIGAGAALGLRRVRTFTGGGGYLEAPRYGLSVSVGVGVYGSEERGRRMDVFAAEYLEGFERDIRARTRADHMNYLAGRGMRPGVSAGLEFRF